MKVQELLETKSETTKGTYAAVRFSSATKNAIKQYLKDHNIPNAVRTEKLHCTVLYSRKHCPNYEAQGEIDPPWKGEFVGFEVWKTQGKLRNEEPKNCLVMKFKCEKLVERHKELMKEHKATYDFPEYKTHITFSYDIGDMSADELPKFDGPIEIVEEYGEDLDLDWADKATKK